MVAKLPTQVSFAGGELDLVPVAPAGRPVQQRRAHHVVAVGDDIGLDLDVLADHALGRVAPAVDLGPDREDHGTRRQLWWKVRTHSRLPKNVALSMKNAAPRPGVLLTSHVWRTRTIRR